MASIIISGDVPPEVNEMVNNLLKGKIGISQFIKFLHDNDLETKVRCNNRDINPSVLNDFIGDTLSTIFSVPEKSECEDDENENLNEGFEKHSKDTVEFTKRLIDDYGNFKEDDIEHAKAFELYLSMMVLGRTYREKAIQGDKKYYIPNFTPENILKFIESLDLPTDKIKVSLERGKSTYYKTKIYNDFDDFKSSMKDVYGIEDVWNPPKEVPEWLESVRDNIFRKFHNEDVVEIDEDEWNEFKEWKKQKIKGFYKNTNKILRNILKTNPRISLQEMLDIADQIEEGFKEDIESLKKLEEFSDSAKKDKSTSKKTTSSNSENKDEKSSKKTPTKTKTTITKSKLKEFKEYADYILLNSIVEDDARDLLLSYAANMDERCKNLYEYLVDLKKNNKSAKLIKYLNEKTGNTNIAFVEL